ncbi:DUF2125 domain-containing protein [Sulfitobacter sp. F26169L]|uniref:DUF2125 domain-containing protein n=1 Tax=Sulfitobacter sp. F26169L TaxID=2996015 RepID=UPI002260FEC4|nr:DUF2125 domain-containing protein [Sulfitobacter sp. F26169L]MCX7565674.1 DUF2125 domain-containing protein [Sulfitobacter sp. F26169L]
MSIARTYMASTAICLSFVSSNAAADLTSAEVWQDWRGYFEGMGYTVTATETVTGETLAVSDIAVQINGGPDIKSMTMQMGPIQFEQNDNGSVDVVTPPSMPIVLEITPNSTERPTRIEMVYSQIGQSMVASGDSSAMRYDYSADNFALELASLRVDGDDFDQNAARFSLTGEAVESLTTVNTGDLREYDQSIKWGSVAYDLFFKSPDSVEAVSVNSSINNPAFTGTSALPLADIAQTQEMAPLLAAGFAFDGKFTTNSTETQMEIVSDEGASKIKTGAGGSTLSFAMGEDGLNYDVNSKQVQVGAQLAGLPFPLFVEMENTGFKLRAPMLKSDEAQDFGLAFNVSGLTMSDIIWALFDPSAQLPRDPATVQLDLSGKAKILVDAFNAETVQGLAESGKSAGEIEALKINNLTIDAVGAKAQATGDLTFDNTDKTTLPGVPKPVGAINVDLAGTNALLDKLVAMGVVPAEQIMGVRMMMGLFAVPGDAPDTLKSTIEFNEEGQILANGQRIK